MESLRPSSGSAVGLVVSGFLGAGKTTLVRNLLAEGRRADIRTAVVSNELGQLGIDRALLAGGAEIVELEGGCVCCQLGSELVQTLATLRERARPQRIIVETSGAALPYDTLVNFWREPIRGWIEDDASVVVVNAEQVLEERDLAGTFEDQVSAADILVLNKLDLVDPDDVPRIDAALREIEPDAPLIHTRDAQVDPRVLFPSVARATPERGRKRRIAEQGDHHHRHDQFESDELRLEAPEAIEALRARLVALDAVRVKGFARTTEGVVVVQGVGRRMTLHPADVDVPPAALDRLVVIRRK